MKSRQWLRKWGMQVSSFAFLKETFSEERKVSKDTSTDLGYIYDEECVLLG